VGKDRTGTVSPVCSAILIHSTQNTQRGILSGQSARALSSEKLYEAIVSFSDAIEDFVE
jgi:hypothetical protein